MPRRSLNDARCLVTGASSGIGQALARELLKRQATVLVTARRSERLEQLQQEFPQAAAAGRLLVLSGDVCDKVTRQRLIDLANQHWQGLDVLVNNAGIGTIARFTESNDDDLERLAAVNLLAPMSLTRAAIPTLTKGNSPIVVNMGSVLSHFPVPFKSEYCATKFAMRGWNDALRMELKPVGIDVLMVNPSTTQSEFFDQALQDSTQINWQRYGAMSPAKVAQKTCRAIEQGKTEINLSLGGRWLVRLHRWMPRTMQKILARDAQRGTADSSHGLSE